MTLSYKIPTFALFPSKRVNSDNVGCCIINREAYLNSLQAIYFTFPDHFWSLVRTPRSVWRSSARLSWPQIKGIISWILICLMKPSELWLTFVWMGRYKTKIGFVVMSSLLLIIHTLSFAWYEYYIMKKRRMLRIQCTWSFERTCGMPLICNWV